MYIPKGFELKDKDKIIAFMQRYSFATIVTSVAGKPMATHLPFHIKEQGEDMILTAHFAKANPQWKDLEQALVIFQGPHAYISPKHYEHTEHVPTWNYIAVHVYGTGMIIADEAQGFSLLENMMQQSEPAFLEQWAGLSDAYKQRLYKGIVPFEIHVTSIAAQQKMSQDMAATERKNIVNALEQDEDSAAKDLGNYMEDHETNHPL